MRASSLARVRIGLVFTAVLGIGLASAAIRGADHADSPDTTENNLDINDIYAFNQGSDIVFIMTVAPLLSPGESTNNAGLNPRGLYELKLDRERDGIAEAVIQIATVGVGNSQRMSVRGPIAPETTGTVARIVPGQSLKGKFGDVLTGNGMTAWAGPADDPFYVDLFGDMSLTSVLNGAFGAALSQQIGSASEQTLAFSDPAVDDLAGLNTLAIVVQLPKSDVADALGIPTDGTFYVWGTTSER